MMRKLSLVLLFVVVFAAVAKGQPSPPVWWKAVSDAIISDGDSVGVVVSGPDTVWFTPVGMYWEPASALDSALLDSLANAKGRFAVVTAGDTSLVLSDVAGGNRIAYWDNDTLYVSDTTAGTDNVYLQSNDRLIITADTLTVRDLFPNAIILNNDTIADFAGGSGLEVIGYILRVDTSWFNINYTTVRADGDTVGGSTGLHDFNRIEADTAVIGGRSFPPVAGLSGIAPSSWVGGNAMNDIKICDWSDSTIDTSAVFTPGTTDSTFPNGTQTELVYYDSIAAQWDSAEVVHPYYKYFPQKLLGYKHWIVATPYYDGSGHEDPWIWVGNDIDNMHLFIDSIPGSPTFGDSLSEALTSIDSSSGYNSDPGLFYDEWTGKLWCYWRDYSAGNYNVANGSLYVQISEPDTTTIWGRSTTDGLTWTAQVKLLQTQSKWFPFDDDGDATPAYDSSDGGGYTRDDTLKAIGASCMSPSIIRYNGLYYLYGRTENILMKRDGTATTFASDSLYRWSASSIGAGTFDTAGWCTITKTSRNVGNNPTWHPEVKVGPDSAIWCVNNENVAGTFSFNTSLHRSIDGGQVFSVVTEVLIDSGVTNSFDNAFIYKTSIDFMDYYWFVGKGLYTKLRLVYSADSALTTYRIGYSDAWYELIPFTGGLDSAEVMQIIADTTIQLADMAANSVDSTKIVQRSVGLTDIAQEGAASGQVIKWDGTDWNPASDSGSTDSFYVAEAASTTTGWKQTGDTIFVDTSSGDLWDTLGTKDTAVLVGSADTTIKYTRDATNDTTKMSVPTGVLVIGPAGMTIIDSARVYNDLYFGNAGSTKFDSSLVDSMVGQKGVYAAGSGTTDSTRLGNGLAIRTSAQDSIAAPADTLEVDTTVIASKAEVALIGDDTTNYQTAYGWGDHSAQGYLTAETDPVWVSDSADYAFKTWVRIEIEDSLNEYSLTTAISSTYETISNVALIGDDTANYQTGYSIANALDTFSRLPLSRVYFDTLASANPDTIKVKYADSSNIALFDTDDLTQGATNLYNQTHTGDVTGATGLAIAAQVIVGDDIDSTAENFVFDGAYHVTSATTDSAYITVQTLEDTAALRLLLAGGTMTGSIDLGDNDITNAERVEADTFYVSVVNADSALKSKHYIDSVSDTSLYAARAGIADSMESPFFIGDIEYTGVEKQWQKRTELNLTDLKFILPDTYLFVSMPESYWNADSSDRYEVIHPSVVYAPDKKFGYPYWLAVGGYGDGGNGQENPMIRVSLDNEVWELPVIDTGGGTVSPPDPLWVKTDVACSTCVTNGLTAEYLSDTKLFFDKHGTLWVIFRATFNYSAGNLDGNPDSVACVDRAQDNSLWATGTSNGYEWSTPVRTTQWDTLKDYMSPAIVQMPSGSSADYRMWAVEELVGVFDTTENIILIWESNKIDTIWDSVGIADVYPFFNASVNTSEPTTAADSALNDAYFMWHFDVLANGADELLMLLTLANEGVATERYPLYIATSNDRGVNWTTRNTPVLEGYDTASIWSDNLYKSAAIWVDKGDHRTLGLYGGAGRNGNPKGIFYTEGFFYDTLFQETIDFTIVNGAPTIMANITRTENFSEGLSSWLFKWNCDTNTTRTDTVILTGYAPADMWLDSLFVTSASDSNGQLSLYYDMALVAPNWMLQDSLVGGSPYFNYINNPDGVPGEELRWTGRKDTLSEAVTRDTFHLTEEGPVHSSGNGDTLKVQAGDKVNLRFVGNMVKIDQWIKIGAVQIKGSRLWRRGINGPTGADGGTVINYIDWQDEYLSFQAVSQQPEAISDSMRLNWYVDRGDTTFVWRDSTWQGSDYMTVKMICDIPFDFDADSVVFYYLTNGSIDTIHVQVPSDTAGAMPIADSALTANVTGWASTTFVRAAVPCNRTLSAGEEVRIKFVDNLATDNDRTWMWKVLLKGQRQ